MSVKFLFPLATVTVIKLSSQLNRCIATVTTSIGYLPSRRASPAFGWYSFYRPTQGRRLSRPVISIFISKALKTTRVNEGSHSFTCHPHVYPRMEWAILTTMPQPQRITALWPILISRPTDGSKLSWPGCLVTYRTIRYGIFTCAQKPTRWSARHKNGKNTSKEKLKTKTEYLRRNGQDNSPWRQSGRKKWK